MIPAYFFLKNVKHESNIKIESADVLHPPELEERMPIFDSDFDSDDEEILSVPRFAAAVSSVKPSGTTDSDNV